MFIMEGYEIRSERNKDGSVTYILMKQIRPGMLRQVDKIKTKNIDKMYTKFKNKAIQLS